MGILDSIALYMTKGAQAPAPAAPLLCLFFSAEWCPDCVSFLPKLVDAYKGFPPGRADVVFVSSDRSKKDQLKYMEEAQHPDWPAVDFDGDARADLKRLCGACAMSEMSTLGMPSSARKGGIPTLAVFRAADGALLTMDGVRDIRQAGAGAVDRWQALSEKKKPES